MNEKPTHFKYSCPKCQAEILKKIDPCLPSEKQEWPYCCGKRTAFRGGVTPEASNEQA